MYQQILVPVDLACGRHVAGEVLARAVAPLCGPGSLVVLAPLVLSVYDLIAREIGPAGPIDPPLDELLGMQDRRVAAVLRAMRASLEPLGAEVAAHPVEAPAGPALLSLADELGIDALLIVISAGRRDADAVRRGVVSFLVDRAPPDVSVHLVRASDENAALPGIGETPKLLGARLHPLRLLAQPVLVARQVRRPLNARWFAWKGVPAARKHCAL